MDKTALPRVIVITGPTATGKTALGIELAKALNGEIVSADSMQVYRGMDIGTAKVSPAETQGVVHHMLSIVAPHENYSVARFVSDADRCARDILDRGKTPVIVGGTGLYIDSLISGRVFAGETGSPELRAGLNARYEERGGERLLEELKKVDPERAEKLHPSDKKRVVRALEVYYSSGETISAHDEKTRLLPPRYDAKIIALTYKNREDLYARVNERVDLMLERGLIDEVRGLLASGLSEKASAMQGIGYKELARFIRGETSLNEALDAIKRESRRYAKRQLTWLRKNEKVHWIVWESKPDFESARHDLAKFLEDYGLE